MFVRVVVCLHWGLALSHHQRGTDFDRGDVCGSPLIYQPSTSARVQNRFEFVELGGDMSSNCTRRHWYYRLVRQQARGTRYQVPGTIYESTASYTYENMGYVQHHLYVTYWYHVWIYEYISIVTHHVPVIMYICKVLMYLALMLFCTTCCSLHYWCVIDIVVVVAVVVEKMILKVGSKAQKKTRKSYSR